MDHSFKPKVFVLSFVGTLLMFGVTLSTYLDSSFCAVPPEDTPRSIFSPTFRVFPCHLVDVAVHSYGLCMLFVIAHKWIMYKREGMHWFLLDYCYFHNLLFILYLWWLVVRVAAWSVDVVPLRVALAEKMVQDSAALSLFLAFLGGSCGALLGAIAIWRNALLFHSSDKMLSSYLHLAPATIQTLVLHVMLQQGSNISDLHNGVRLSNLIQKHALMFVAWQVIYHVVFETRKVHRERKSKPEKIRNSPARVLGNCGTNPTDRITSYTWLMQSPPFGKEGFLYKFATLFGVGVASKVMFSILQGVLHLFFLLISYPAVFATVHIFDDVWFLLLFISFFFLLAVHNAAQMQASWIMKLKKLAREAEGKKE